MLHDFKYTIWLLLVPSGIWLAMATEDEYVALV